MELRRGHGPRPGPASGRTASLSTRRCGWSWTSVAGSITRTSRGWCTATSSPRTFGSRATGWSRSSTSGSPDPRSRELTSDRARAGHAQLHGPGGLEGRAGRPPRRHVGDGDHPVRGSHGEAPLRVGNDTGPRLQDRARAPASPGHAAGLPEALVAVARKTLEKTPYDRYADLADMAQALLNAIGATPPADPLVEPAVRERAYARNFEEARQRLADNDLDGGAAAARRAQAFDPAKTAILSLISTIEEQLRNVETVRRPAPRVPRPGPQDPTRQVGLPQGTHISHPTIELVPPSLGTATLTDLRTRGASVFRELATFGETAGHPVGQPLAGEGRAGRGRRRRRHPDVGPATRGRRSSTLRTEMHQRTGHDALALCLAFSPDGKLLASGHVDASVHLWDVEHGQEIPVKLRHDAVVAALAFSPDGSTLATGSVDSNLRLWDVGAALRGARPAASSTASPRASPPSPTRAGATWLVTGHSNRCCACSTRARAVCSRRMRGPEAPVTLLVPSPDGRTSRWSARTARSASSTSRAASRRRRWRATGSRPRRCPSSRRASTSRASPRRTRCSSGTSRRCKPIAALSGPATESFVGLALFGGGDHIAVALGDGRIRVWGPAS